MKLGPRSWAKVPAGLRHTGWPELLTTWARLMRRFNDPGLGDNEVAYWYGERALTGLLAAAAWQTRKEWWALEEFLGKRHIESQIKKKKATNRGSGRGDLWLGLHVSRGLQWGFTIEAKQSESGRNAETIKRAISKKLTEAKTQLHRLEPDFRYGYPMAVCYHIPAIAKSRITKWPRDTFEKVADLFKRDPETIVAAWQPKTDKAPIDDKWAFPGVLFIGQLYRKLPGGKGRPRTWTGKREKW